MQTFFQNSRRSNPVIPALAIMAGALAVTVLLPLPAEAQGFGFRAGAASGQNGAVTGSRGVLSNGQGAGATRRNLAIGDGQGNGGTASGLCAANIYAEGCQGRFATWNSDGSFSGMSRTEITGENGYFSGARSLDRAADGTWSGASTVDASGKNGRYNGSANLDDGTYSRDATYAGAEGQTATVEGAYEAGSGGSRSVICIDASGATVECP